MSISGFLQRIRTDERGATAVEYGLILTLIVIAIMGSLNAFAEVTIGMWTDVDQKVQDAVQQNDG